MKNKYAITNRGMIVKSKETQNFAIIPNKMLRDVTLSLKSKGLLCILLSLPDDWAIYKTNLHQFSGDGRDATTKAFNELLDKKYILKFERGIKGQFGWDYVVFNEPQITADDIENPFLKTRNGNSITEM